MTPLLPAPQPSSPQPPPAPSRGAAQRVPGEDSFALLLQQGQASLHPVSDDAPGELQVLLEELPVEVPELLDAAPDPATLPLQPAAPWPPAGLAGLQLSATAGGLPPACAAPVLPGAAAAAGPLLEPDLDPLAVTRLSATGIDAAGPDERAEPASAAFALPPLPSPAPVRDVAPMLAAPVPAPDVRADDFSERFGAQLQWMAGQQIGHARIRVSPQELGPVEVLLRLDGERISADFISSHPETRQALEQGLPRLRDLLGEHGFQLAHADVGHHSPSSPDGDAAGTGTRADPGLVGGDAPLAADDRAPVRVARGLIDAYA